MASKPVNPEDPGQAQVFLNDLLLMAQSLSDFQAMALLRALNYEWEFGHQPADAKVWQRLARPTNGRQKIELQELADQYDQHALVLKMRERREERIAERQTRIIGAQDRQTLKAGMGSSEKTQQGSAKKKEVRSLPSDEVKFNGINQDIPEVSDNSHPSSSSSSSSSSSPKESNTPEENKNNKLSQPSAAALSVFDYWRERLKHPQAIFTKDRKRAVESRLKDGYSPDRLKRAVDGCRASPFHQGQNDRNSVYDDLELICRNGKNVEWFIAKAEQMEGQANGTTNGIGGPQAIAGSLPSESGSGGRWAAREF